MKRLSPVLAVLLSLLAVFSCKKEPFIAIEEFSVFPEELDMAVKETRQLYAIVTPEDATSQEVIWSSDRPNIVSVTPEGEIKASPINEGSATITARCGDKEAYCNVKVTIPVQMFNFGMYQSKSLSVGDVWEWQVYYQPLTATERNNIVFGNSDPSVAELKQDGKNRAQFTVTAKKLGSTKITAKCGGKETEMLVCVDAVKATNVIMNPASITLDPFITRQLTATVEPSNATNKSLLWYSMVPEIATVENGLVRARRPGSVIIAVYCGDKYAYCNVTVTDHYPEGAVDLGLSVLWASCNLGKSGLCESPNKFGAFYAWGETEMKTEFSWDNYKFSQDYNGPYSRYNTYSSTGPIDNLTTLLPEDDAAHVKLGGAWRMPTNDEFSELMGKCTAEFTYYDRKIFGVRFTSKIEGYTDKSIFLPMNSRFEDLVVKGSGAYWTSTLYDGSSRHARAAFFSISGFRKNLCTSYTSRNQGFWVRPVCD